MLRKIILLILIFFTGILITNAGYQSDPLKFFNENDKISVDKTDLSYCSGKQEKGIYALSPTMKYPYTNTEIDKAETELTNMKVDTKNKSSVASYNNKLAKIQSMITANNNAMKKVGIPVSEYCKPYNCNKKFPGTVYQKSTDKCICSDGKEFDKLKNKCPIKEVALPVRQNIEIKDDLDMQKGELLLWIIGILLGLVILYVAFKD